MPTTTNKMFTLGALGMMLSACGSDADPGLGPLADAATQDMPAGDAGVDEPLEGCERGTLEDDFGAQPLMGPGVVNGALEPGSYLFSTTYLRLRREPAAQMRFGQLMEPILADLMSRDGLVAFSLGGSDACGVARTLTVWRDDSAMLGFVTSAAHGAAVRSVSEVSRGGSLVTHWAGSEGEGSWQRAANKAGLDDGPFY